MKWGTPMTCRKLHMLNRSFSNCRGAAVQHLFQDVSPFPWLEVTGQSTSDHEPGQRCADFKLVVLKMGSQEWMVS